MQRISVDLPAPLGPTSAVTRPAMDRLTPPSRARWPDIQTPVVKLQSSLRSLVASNIAQGEARLRGGYLLKP